MTLQKIEVQSPEAHSADLIADNIAQLKALFPELVTETVRDGQTVAALNVDVLKGLIGDATGGTTELTLKRIASLVVRLINWRELNAVD